EKSQNRLSLSTCKSRTLRGIRTSPPPLRLLTYETGHFICSQKRTFSLANDIAGWAVIQPERLQSLGFELLFGQVRALSGASQRRNSSPLKSAICSPSSMGPNPSFWQRRRNKQPDCAKRRSPFRSQSAHSLSPI